jgi:hypothetical protein
MMPAAAPAFAAGIAARAAFREDRGTARIFPPPRCGLASGDALPFGLASGREKTRPGKALAGDGGQG